MRDLPGVNEFSKSDNDCNKQVKRVKDLAKLKLEVSDYILALSQDMTVEQTKALKEPKEYVIVHDPKISGSMNKNYERDYAPKVSEVTNKSIEIENRVLANKIEEEER